VLVNWVYNYFTYDRGPRLILSTFPETDALPEATSEGPQRARLATAPTSPEPGGSLDPRLR
jgi:NADH dehydrogenase